MLKSVVNNTAAQLVAKFVGAGLTFLTTILILRLASPALYGDLTKALVLIAIGATVIDFGLNAITVRNLGHGRSLVAEFSALLATRFFLSLLVVVILNFALSFMPASYATSIRSAFFVGSLAIIFQGIYTSCNAVFQHRQNYWLSTLSTTLGAATSAGLTYYYLLVSPSLLHFLLASTFGYLVMALVSLGLVGLRPLRLPFSRLLTLLKAAAPLGVILLASVASSKLDTLVLGTYWPSAVVGEYGFAYRIFDVLLVFPVFLTNALYPLLVRSHSTQTFAFLKKTQLLLFVSGSLLALFTYVAAPYLTLVRPGLTLSVRALQLLGLSLPLFFVTAPLMWYLISRNQEKSVLRVYGSSTLLNLALNLLFVPRHGVTAAALITGLTELFIFLALLYHSLNTKKARTYD